MRIDHRRPLVAYVLVTLACAFVLAQGMRDFPSLGPGPSVGAFSDDTMTPSEASDRVIDPTVIGALPEPEVVDDDEEEEGTSLSPQFDAVEDFLETPLFPGDTTDDSSGTTAQQPVVAGTQLLAGATNASLVGNGGGSGPGGGDNDGGSGGLPDPDVGAGGGFFNPPLGGPGDGDGDGEAPGGGNASGPVPHVFDHVPDGGHPNGLVGPPPGNGDGNGGGKHNDGHKDKGSKDKGSKDKGSKDKGSKDKGSKDKGSKDKGSKDKGSKDRGHEKSHGNKHVKGSKAKGPKKINPKHGKRGPG